MKQLMLNMMCTVGVFAPFRVANRNNTLIVTYHRFSETTQPNMTSAKVLAAQLDYLTSRYRILPLAEVVDRLAQGKSLPVRTAAITIDDGYHDAYDVALPLFRHYQAPATLFVTTGFLDRAIWLWTDKTRYLIGKTLVVESEARIAGQTLQLNCKNDEARQKTAVRINDLLKSLPDEVKENELSRLAEALAVELPLLPPKHLGPIRWDQAREMDAAGMAIESHTVTHPILTNVDDARLKWELCESKARLESELQRPAQVFCYPNGADSPRIRNAVIQAGYTGAVGTIHGLNDARTDIFCLQRIHSEPDMAHFTQSTSGFELFKNKLRGAPQREWAEQYFFNL